MTMHSRDMRDQWDDEANRRLDDQALRGDADWFKSIGDEDVDDDVIEENLEDYGWELLGEDDFVSNPTAESDMPTWLDDDYDDTYQDHLDEPEQDVIEEGDDDFYRG